MGRLIGIGSKIEKIDDFSGIDIFQDFSGIGNVFMKKAIFEKRFLLVYAFL